MAQQRLGRRLPASKVLRQTGQALRRQQPRALSPGFAISQPVSGCTMGGATLSRVLTLCSRDGIAPRMRATSAAVQHALPGWYAWRRALRPCRRCSLWQAVCTGCSRDSAGWYLEDIAWGAAAPQRQHGVPEAAPGLPHGAPVLQPSLLKCAEGVRRQHLRPLVGEVPGCRAGTLQLLMNAQGTLLDHDKALTPRWPRTDMGRTSQVYLHSRQRRCARSRRGTCTSHPYAQPRQLVGCCVSP